MKKGLPILFISAILFLVSLKLANAQITSSGIAIPLPVNEAVEDGDIICTSLEGTLKCSQEYDPSMFGVYTQNPSAEISDSELEDTVSVISQGVTNVRVTTVNGAIDKGDFVTSSKTPGAAMKATRNGYVLGVALEDYDSNNNEVIGKINVAVNIHPEAALKGSRNNLVQILREGLAIPLFEPLESLRYLLAVLIVLISFVLGLVYFGRASRAGIEAIGRNPLAKKAIQMSIIMHVVLSVVIILVGLAIAYLILIL